MMRAYQGSYATPGDLPLWVLREEEGVLFALAERHPYADIPEADDVGAVVAGQVGEEPRVLLDALAAGVVAEVRDDPQ
jgi:hypothetical protein